MELTSEGEQVGASCGWVGRGVPRVQALKCLRKSKKSSGSRTDLLEVLLSEVLLLLHDLVEPGLHLLLAVGQ